MVLLSLVLVKIVRIRVLVMGFLKMSIKWIVLPLSTLWTLE